MQDGAMVTEETRKKKEKKGTAILGFLNFFFFYFSSPLPGAQSVLINFDVWNSDAMVAKVLLCAHLVERAQKRSGGSERRWLVSNFLRVFRKQI